MPSCVLFDREHCYAGAGRAAERVDFPSENSRLLGPWPQEAVPISVFWCESDLIEHFTHVCPYGDALVSEAEEDQVQLVDEFRSFVQAVVESDTGGPLCLSVHDWANRAGKLVLIYHCEMWQVIGFVGRWCERVHLLNLVLLQPGLHVGQVFFFDGVIFEVLALFQRAESPLGEGEVVR